MTAWLRLLVPAMVLSASTASAEPAWSAPVDGVRARLTATATTDPAKRPQLELWLEIENVSDTDGGLDLPWGYVGDMLQLTLEDTGKAVPPLAIGGNHPSGPPYLVALPTGATLRVPISKAAWEYPSATRTMFRPLTFQAWDVPAKHGKLAVRGKLSPHALEKGVKPGPRAWSKSIELPRLELP